MCVFTPLPTLETKFSNENGNTLLVSRSEYPRDKPFLLTMVSYFFYNKIKREKRKKHEPFQSYLLTGQDDSAKKAG